MIETVQNLRAKTFGNALFVEYYEWSHDEDTSKMNLIMEPITMMTLSEYIQYYGFLEENVIRSIWFQILSALETLYEMSMFHGNLSINNIFVDQYNLNIKVADYGIYNDLYGENTLDLFEGSKMDLFWLAILLLKWLGKLRLDLPLDLGSLQYKVVMLK